MILVDRPADETVGSALLLHGFTRSPHDLDRVSEDCRDLGARTVRPALGSVWWPSSTNNSRHLDRVCDEVEAVLADGPVVAVGHSAGAAAGAWLAAGLRDRGRVVSTLVMIDGVESPTRLIRRSWPLLAEVRIRAACAPPSRCNRHGALARWLAEQGRPVDLVVLPGLGHGDIEGPTRAVYRHACGDDPRQPSADALRRLVIGWVAEGLDVPLVGGPTPGR